MLAHGMHTLFACAVALTAELTLHCQVWHQDAHERRCTSCKAGVCAPVPESWALTIWRAAARTVLGSKAAPRGQVDHQVAHGQLRRARHARVQLQQLRLQHRQRQRAAHQRAGHLAAEETIDWGLGVHAAPPASTGTARIPLARRHLTAENIAVPQSAADPISINTNPAAPLALRSLQARPPPDHKRADRRHTVQQRLNGHLPQTSKCALFSHHQTFFAASNPTTQHEAAHSTGERLCEASRQQRQRLLSELANPTTCCSTSMAARLQLGLAERGVVPCASLASPAVAATSPNRWELGWLLGIRHGCVGAAWPG